jgi:hypothetical protein
VKRLGEGAHPGQAVGAETVAAVVVEARRVRVFVQPAQQIVGVGGEPGKTLGFGEGQVHRLLFA